MDSTQRNDDAVVSDGECLHEADLEGAITAIAGERNRAEARRHDQQGSSRFAKQELDGALAEFDTALRLDPGLASAYNNRGVVRHQLRDLPGALADFDAALRLNPRFADAYGNRAAAGPSSFCPYARGASRRQNRRS